MDRKSELKLIHQIPSGFFAKAEYIIMLSINILLYLNSILFEITNHSINRRGYIYTTISVEMSGGSKNRT